MPKQSRINALVATSLPRRPAIIAAALALCCTGIAHSEVIVSETFGGLASDDLNGSAAEVFDADIVAAGGVNAWAAHQAYNQDGSIDSYGDSSSAYLSLGSYINDAKGQADAIFVLQATLTIEVGSGADDWIALSFFRPNVSTASPFYTNSAGNGTALLRADDGTNANYYAGSGTANGSDAGDLTPSGTTGSTTFTITLDFSEADDVTSFGSISFSNSTTPSTFTYDYTSTRDVTAIGISDYSALVGKVSNFTLSRVPEPGSLVLIGLGSVALACRRKIRI